MTTVGWRTMAWRWRPAAGNLKTEIRNDVSCQCNAFYSDAIFQGIVMVEVLHYARFFVQNDPVE